MNFLHTFFSSDGFMPHGHCYLWNPEMVWLHVVSDSLIAFAYLTIPVTLVYIARKRKDLPFDWMFACFGIFILACGATHALEVWTLWHPTYWVSGAMKAVTAAASIATAILLVRLIPRLLGIPSPTQLRQKNVELVREIEDRRSFEERLLASESRFRAVTQSISDAIISLGTDGKVIFWNTAAENIFGYREAEMLGQPFDRIIAPHVRESEPLGMNRYLIGGSSETAGAPTVLTGLTKDQREFPIELTLSTWTTEAGTFYTGIIRDVTSRLSAEEELHWKTAFLEAQVSCSSDGVLVVNDQGKKILQNERFTALFKIPQEIANDSDDREQIRWVVSKARDPAAFSARVAHFYAHPLETCREEVEMKDGMTFERYTAPVIGRDGKHFGRIWMLHDITERKQAENALHESRMRYHSLFEHMLDGYAYCELIFEHGVPRDFIYEEVNSAFEPLTGLKNVTGKRVSEVVPGFVETQGELLERYARVARTGNPERLETYIAPLQTWFSISVYSYEPDHFVAIFDNITERRNTEIALHESKLFAESIAENSTNIIYLHDLESGKNVYANRNLATFLGLSQAQMHELGDDVVTTVVHPEDAPASPGIMRTSPGLQTIRSWTSSFA